MHYYLADDMLYEVDGLQGGLLHARHVRVQGLELLAHQPARGLGRGKRNGGKEGGRKKRENQHLTLLNALCICIFIYIYMYIPAHCFSYVVHGLSLPPPSFPSLSPSPPPPLPRLNMGKSSSTMESTKA